MEIKQYKVEKGAAVPMNKYAFDVFGNPYEMGTSEMYDKLYSEFGQEVKKHTCVTNAPDGVYDADCFGPIQFQCKKQIKWNNWVTTNSYPKIAPYIDFEDYKNFNEDIETRQFLPFKAIPKTETTELPSPEKGVKTAEVPIEMTGDRVIEFIDWINNNWFIPAEDSNWKLDIKNIEFQRTIPKKDSNFFDAEELLQMFLNGEGES